MAERKEIDFSLFTDAQLLDLSRQVDREITRRQREVRRLVRARGALLEGEPPRYRNPFNVSQTWSGKGTEPRWVLQALSLGYSLEDLERDDNRPVSKTSRKRSGRPPIPG